ncbi:MAG: hypothetical protein E6G95_19120 [Alphaproteobacteria bacterium]|nr:MAG: hypothetical protein E6G95_19120 [Alphaproteobacteria bacterium]
MSIAQSSALSQPAAPFALARRLFATRFGGVGVVILLAVSILSVFAPWFASTGPMDIGSPSMQPPS